VARCPYGGGASTACGERMRCLRGPLRGTPAVEAAAQDGNGAIPAGDWQNGLLPETTKFPRSLSPTPASRLDFPRPRPRLFLEIWSFLLLSRRWDRWDRSRALASNEGSERHCSNLSRSPHRLTLCYLWEWKGGAAGVRTSTDDDSASAAPAPSNTPTPPRERDCESGG
jgi:hypothetical protein